MKTNKKNNIKKLLLAIHKRMLVMVNKAIKIIRDNCGDVQAEIKLSYAGVNDDCVTIADRLAQEMYLREIKKFFPTFGIIAEEKELTIPCTDPRFNVYFTIDPLDGTKAFARKQSHGVGTMLALVCDEKIVAVAIGDANTGEIYSYANDEDRCIVQRLRFGKAYRLEPITEKPLTDLYAFLLDHPREQPPVVQKMILPHPKHGGLFKDFEIGSGSIGLRFARLWKGEVGGIFLTPTYETPWDLMPVLGISKKLGFKFLRYENETGMFIEAEPKLTKKVVEMPHNMLIIHEAHIAELNQWINKNK